MKRLSYLSLCFGLMIGGNTLAVPLFGETAGTIKEGNLTLYKDDADPKKVYFMPNASQFALDKNSMPLFNFVYWGLDQQSSDGGAYMTFTARLASDDLQKADLDNYIKAHPEMEVAVLPIKSSSIGLTSTDGSEPPLWLIAKEFDFPKFGPMADGQIGVNAVLTKTGGTVFYSALKHSGGGNIVKFDFCFDIQGFGPSMDASITANMRQVYDYFEAHGSFGGWWHSVDIRHVTETLRNDKAITIVQNGGDAKDSEILDKVAEEITARLFTEKLSPTPIAAANGNRIWNFGVSTVHKEELHTETWNWNRRTLEERQFCSDINLQDLAPFVDKLVVKASYP